MAGMGKEKGLPDRLSAEVSGSFPSLIDYEVTSPITSAYNCIAYAAGDENRWWEPAAFPSPGYFWPHGAERGDGLRVLESCFRAIGFEVCADGTWEDGYTRVALYQDEDGNWTHAARQLEDGTWTSKLGEHVDIRHKSPDCVSGPVYGAVGIFMRKRTP
jgi:hypothetical protein